MKTSIPTLRRAILALLALGTLSGCARTLPTAPLVDPSALVAPGSSPGTTPDGDTVPPPPGVLTRSAGGSGGGDLLSQPAILNWVTILEQLVAPKVTTRVSAGHYELVFGPEAVKELELVTIKEYDEKVVDVTFGPHGLEFGEPVTLSLDFRGTRADPESEKWDGSDPVLYWLDEEHMRWVEVPGRTDWENRRHVVRLEHFSRYVLGGKAGWKHEPSRAED